MGGGPSKEHASINEDEYARRYQTILQNFVVEKQSSDKVYGNCTIYRYRGKDSTYRIVEVLQFYQNEESMTNAFQSYTNIMDKNLNNLLQIHMCRQSVEDSLCSTSFKVYKLYDYITCTLEQKIQERIQGNNYFREEELWSLYEQLVSVISFMEKHEYLRADTVFIVNQINEQPVYKLFYRTLLNYKTNFEDCQKGQTAGRYLTVDALKQLKENQDYSDAVHQDKFSLGMIMLQAATLESLDMCYDYTHFELNTNLLSEKFLKMRNSYSSDLSNLVYQLLFQDDQGFDWTQLNVQLSSISLLCGTRIQDSYQNQKLENLPPIVDILAQQNTQQGNTSLNPLLSNNIPPNLNQSLNNGVLQGNFIGNNDIIHQQEQNQQFNGSPKTNLQSGMNNGSIYGNNAIAGNFNQFQNIQLGHQHSISNQPYDLNAQNNLLQSNVHSPYNPGLGSPLPNNNAFGSPLPNSITQNAVGGQINQFGNISGANSIYNGTNLNSLSHSPNMGVMNGNMQNQYNNNGFPQLQLNNNNLPVQNNIGAQNQNNQYIDQNMLIQMLFQMSQQLQQQQSQQQQQQQYIGESFYQSNHNNNSQMTYSPLRGANIFNQFNPKNQKMNNDNISDLNKSFSALNGIPRRKTTFQYEDGSFYDGEMVLDYRDGFGKLVFSNKGVYEGTWKLNKMHGKGTLYYPNSDIAYEGDWFEDQFNNFGHLYNAKAQHTKQKFDFKDFSLIKNYWLKYEGEFTLDRKQGFGTLQFTNGERYSGNFKNDAVHGYGVYYQQDGESFSGYWEDNCLVKRM